jgi:hypothetical protein
MTTSLSNEGSSELAHLAERINAAHAAAEGALRTGLSHARMAGDLLVQAQGQLAHGQWTPWLAANVCFSPRTARAYMQIAKRWPELEAKRQRVAVLSFRDAVKLLAEAAEKEPAPVLLPPLSLDVHKRYWCNVRGTMPPTPLGYYANEVLHGRMTKRGLTSGSTVHQAGRHEKPSHKRSPRRPVGSPWSGPESDRLSARQHPGQAGTWSSR